MAWDWQRFCDTHHIHYVTSGPNVSHGNIAIKCPMCGSSDPSQHMVLNLSGEGWKCWRSQNHRGKSPAFLVAAILGITADAARDMVGGSTFIPDDFMAQVRRNVGDEVEEVKKLPPLEMPREFRPIDGSYMCKPAVDYLIDDRGFTWGQVKHFTDIFGLRYASSGRYRGRIIFPVIQHGQLMTWTGRAVHKDVELRYSTLSDKPERVDNPARGPITEFLMWFDDLMKNEDDSDTLLFGEGPFDALKMRVLGHRHRVEATCFTTASPSLTQIDLLYELSKVYPRMFMVLDRNTLHTALRIQSAMASLNVGILHLPDRFKDPGELRNSQDMKQLLDAHR